MWHLSESSHTNFIFPTGNPSFLIRWIKKTLLQIYTFTHILLLSLSCEQDDLNSCNKFLHLTKPIIEKPLWLYHHRFSSIFGFSLVGSKAASVAAASKMLIGRSHICITFLVFFIMILPHFLLFLYHSIHSVLHSRLAKTILQLCIYILKITIYFVKRLSVRKVYVI